MSQPAFKRSKSVALRHLKELASEVDKVDFSEHWRRKMRNVFRLNDPENTGYATRHGLKVMGERLIAATDMSVEEAEETRRIVDDWGKDSISEPDAKIGFDEFCKLRYVMLTHPDIKEEFRGFLEEIATLWFQVIDTNHNGVISKKEWRNFFKCMNIENETIADAAFDAVNVKQDGGLSKDEFVTGFFEFVSNQEKGRYDTIFGPLPDV